MDTERQDEGELTPEELQEKSDEARESFEEIDEASVGIVNALSHHKSLMGVITEAIKKTK